MSKDKEKITEAVKALKEIGIGIGDDSFPSLTRISKATDIPENRVKSILKEMSENQ